MTEQLKRLAAAAGVATVCLAGLAACGGGGGSGDDGLTQDQRDDALASTWPGMLTFAQAQIAAATTETAEPRSIAGITPPTADTAEPAPI